jgi:putative transposase
MTQAKQSSDLSDGEWALLAPLLEPPTRRGRPRRHDRRLVLEAVLYVLRGGLAWRLLPERFPPWPSVYDQFRRWRRAGTWQRINDALRERTRRLVRRAPQPTAAIIDSQSVRTSEMGGERGYDGGKKINGRKRHLVVDTQGLILQARVHPADVHDRRAAELVLEGLQERYATVVCLFADMSYQGLGDWLETRLGWQLLIVKRPSRWVWAAVDQPPPSAPAGFQVLPKRWIVERTFAWLGRQRRLAKEWERLATTTETWIYLAMSRLMANRLAKAAA